MRKIILTLVASLLSCSALSAFWPEAADSILEFGAGYRKDNLQFKVLANPNANSSSSYSDSSYGSYYSYSDYSDYSESEPSTDLPVGSSTLNWKNLNIAFIEGRGKYVTCDNFYLRAGGDYGWICSGENTDSDYLKLTPESPKVEFSRSTARTKGHVYDANIAVGYEFHFCDDNLTFAPLIGYSWKGQHVHDSHLVQEIAFDPEYPSEDAYSYYLGSSGQSIDGLHSSYKTRWNGPFVGFDSEYHYDCEWSIIAGYEYHWGQYHAKGDWNLREDLPNGFTHHAKNSYGHVFDLGLKWDFCECWTASLHGGFQYFRADHGRDRALVSETDVGDIDAKLYVSAPLKKVQWYSGSIALDLGLVF
jgi:hypothetical protein